MNSKPERRAADLPADDWARIDRALEQVLQAPESTRPQVLEALGQSDPALRREVESLLAAASDGVADLLESPAEDVVLPFLSEVPFPTSMTASPGAAIGPYRLLQELGRGGMGTVYLAERADGEFQHRVALKLVTRGADTQETIDRFRRERQILARLQHANIARLLDGGSTDDGVPYYVMEHVDGVAITAFCRESSRPVRDRLRLFVTVCRAVQYAHQNLIVHRDLKPSNVFVTHGGEVKLLDFGIAKVLASEPDGPAPATRLLLTPEYASPEQVQGQPVTTASDVYQLGLLLYELLAGVRPYQIRDVSPVEIERVVCRTEAPPPSVMAAKADDNGADARARELQGDLDAIVMTALRKDPARRYSSVEALAEDVERHLTGSPIAARGDSLAYRAGLLVRRHRAAIAAIAAFIILLLGFAAFYTFQMRRERDAARLEAAKATRTAEFLEDFFERWHPDTADQVQVRAVDLLDVSVARVEREMQGQPDVQAAMFSLLGSLYTNLGNTEKARALLDRALAAQRSGLVSPHADLAATLARLGRLAYAAGSYRDAESAYREAITTFESLGLDADTLRTRQGLATVLLQGEERFAEAEAEFRDIVRRYGPAADDPSLTLADATRGLGLALFYQARYEEAEAVLRPLLARNRRLFGDVHPVTVLTLQALSATVRDRGRIDEAVQLQREVADISRRLYGGEHANTMFADFVLAFTLHRNGDFVSARQINGDVVERTRRAHGAVHPLTGRYVRFQAYVLLDLGELDAARSMLREALSIYRQSFSYVHTDEAGILNRLAYVQVLTGGADARDLLDEAVARHRNRTPEDPVFVTHGPHFLAMALHLARRKAEANELYRTSLDLYRQQLPASHPYVSAVRAGLEARLPAP